MNDDPILGKSDKTRSPKSKLRARCPSCSSWVNLRDAVEVWDVVNCPECHTLLEVIDLRPPTLDYAQDDTWEDEDWEEDEEDWN
jgi:lysine biosynthesis protein LysW